MLVLLTEQYGQPVLVADNVVTGTQISHRASVDMYIKTALILSGLVASCYGTFFCFSNFWVSADWLSSAQTHITNISFCISVIIAVSAAFWSQFCSAWGLHG